MAHPVATKLLYYCNQVWHIFSSMTQLFFNGMSLQLYWIESGNRLKCMMLGPICYNLRRQSTALTGGLCDTTWWLNHLIICVVYLLFQTSCLLGLEFDYFGIGEFWDCKSLSNDFGAQVRFFKYKSTSFAGAVATKTGNVTTTIYTLDDSKGANSLPKTRYKFHNALK